MSTTSSRLHLPDLVKICPFSSSVNHHYETVAPESSAWINSYNIFTNHKRAVFIQSSAELLCAYAYPYADAEAFRTCCDFVNLLFTLDEMTDDQTGDDARTTGQKFLETLQSGDSANSIIGKITAEFRARILARPWKGVNRFIDSCGRYLAAVGEEADVREAEEVLDLHTYTIQRRENSAIQTCFNLFEYITGKDMPVEVWEDEGFQSLYFAAVDMVAFSNDIYSYDMEQAKGHTSNNLLTVIGNEYACSLQEACDRAGAIFEDLLATFVEDKANLLPVFRDSDAVQTFISCLEYWIIGNLVWSLEGTRYFGNKHEDIKRTLIVELRPREYEGVL